MSSSLNADESQTIVTEVEKKLGRKGCVGSFDKYCYYSPLLVKNSWLLAGWEHTHSSCNADCPSRLGSFVIIEDCILPKLSKKTVPLGARDPHVCHNPRGALCCTWSLDFVV
ncbi:hypothetical protein VNO78_10171 [Psophocarpus tetragonolobus]|uniref:Uncharacterized protein n=1 Tax=Psophocarpus tetragonolobus TaxID=3891 RepID=A0AAN9XMB2_PSOTE